MNKIKTLMVLCLLTVFAPHDLVAKPLVTGWHKVFISGAHSGYLVQEFKFDKNSNEFTATNFVHLTLPGSRLDRSLVAKASKDLKPISYQYTEKTGDKVKLIDASFAQNVMNLTVTENGQKTTRQVQIKDGTFLGIFLYFLVITNKKGIKVGQNFEYYAIAEESGNVATGKADIVELSTLKGLDVFKVLNKFSGSSTVEHVTPTGQIVKTHDPVSNVETHLVKTKQDAVGSFPVSTKSLSLLFGAEPMDSFPAPSEKNLAPKTSPLPKGIPVPPGKGQ